MRWYFRFLKLENGTYYYSYSTESKEYDGVISYNEARDEPEIVKPCSFDKGSDWSCNRTLQHFWKVIQENFPKERSVLCG